MKGTKKRNRRGDGTVYQLSTTGKWIGQYIKDGKRKSITGNSKEEVSDRLRKILVEIKENRYIGKDNKTIGEILEENLQNQEHSNKIKESTKLRNRETAKVIFDELGNRPIQKVQRQGIQKFLNDVAQVYSNSYIDKIYMQLSKVYRRALSDDIISKNPFATKDIDKPKSVREDKKVDALTREEQRAFMEQLEKEDYKYKDIFYVLFETGMRIGEVLSLKRDDIDFQKGVIKVRRTLTRDSNDRPIVSNQPKTSAGVRDVPLTKHLRQVFARNMFSNNRNKYIFTKPDGRIHKYKYNKFSL